MDCTYLFIILEHKIIYTVIYKFLECASDTLVIRFSRLLRKFDFQDHAIATLWLLQQSLNNLKWLERYNDSTKIFVELHMIAHYYYKCYHVAEFD